MFTNKTILMQMQAFISRYDFKKVVSEHNGDKWIKTFSTRNLLNVMIYVHMASKLSLRDILDSLMSKATLWYHLGVESISRNNLSHALMNRPSEIFEKTFYMMLGKLQSERGAQSDKRFRFKMPLKIIDSTTISLCLTLFSWAKFRKTKGGIKLHLMLNCKDQVPNFVNFSDAGKHDIKAADSMPIDSRTIYTLDRGYFCYRFMAKINEKGSFFVIRTKSNTQYRKLERRERKDKNIKADWVVKVSGIKANEYPQRLRVVKYFDREKQRTFEYMTNNFDLSAKTIADIYKARWDIELFFKWIKQNLKIKKFIGTSENAVRIQIWTALIVLLLLEYIRFKSKTCFTMIKTFRVLSENILTAGELFYLLRDRPPNDWNRLKICDTQLTLDF
jgi:hypothetical protein